MTIDMKSISEWLGPRGFHSILRMSVVEHDAEAMKLTLSVPYREEYARIPEVGDYHGGVLAAVFDVVGAFAAALATGTMVTTMNMRTDFLRPPIRCDLIATAKVVRAGRSTVVVDAELHDSSGKLYAVTRGTWSVVKSAA